MTSEQFRKAAIAYLGNRARNWGETHLIAALMHTFPGAELVRAYKP